MNNNFSGSLQGFEVDLDIVNGINQINQDVTNNQQAEVRRQVREQTIKIAIPLILGLAAVILIFNYGQVVNKKAVHFWVAFYLSISCLDWRLNFILINQLKHVFIHYL